MTNLWHVGDGEACVGEEVPYEGSVRLGAGISIFSAIRTSSVSESAPILRMRLLR
jgi:hypothetical protein